MELRLVGSHLVGVPLELPGPGSLDLRLLSLVLKFLVVELLDEGDLPRDR